MSKVTITLTEDQLKFTLYALDQWTYELQYKQIADKKEIAFYKRIMTKLAKAKIS